MGRPRKKNLHLPQFVQERHGAYWWCPTGQAAHRICASTDEDMKLYEFLAKATDPKPIISMNDLFDRYMREVFPFKLGPRTQKDYVRHIKKLRGVFGHMRPDEIRPRDIGQYLATGTGPIQRNREIAVLSAVFSKAIGKWYVCETNPCAKVERNESEPRTRYVSDDEYNGFRATCPERLQIAMELALLTGQRQGDLLALTWDDVDPDENGVRFCQSKTQKRLLVDITPALQDVLERARRVKPDLPRKWVIRKRSGQPYTSEGFRAIWQRYQTKWAKLGGARFTFHDLRAKSASDTKELQEAYERLGHQSQSMTRRVYDRGIRRVKPLK